MRRNITLLLSTVRSIPMQSAQFSNETAFKFSHPIRSDWKGSAVPKQSTKQLFSSLQIRDIKLKNRVVVSPMCMYTSVDGFFNDWHLSHLGRFAVGGCALILTEASAVEPIGRITPFDAGIWKDEHISGYKRVVDFIHANNSLAGIQLAHAGRKASTVVPWIFKKPDVMATPEKGGWTPVGPSPIAWSSDYTQPIEMSIQDIKRVIQCFKDAAIRAQKCGFDVIEIHGAHGYLLHSFYSPISNKRTDDYGGSFENRIRMLVEVVKAVRSVWQKPIFVRLSCTDWVEGGWDVEQTVQLAKVLKSLQVDVIDCSSGGNSHLQKIKEGPGYQVPFAERVKEEVGDSVLVGAVGKITEAQQAEEILSTGKADMVFMARELLRNPHWPLFAAKTLGVEVDWPLQYERAKL